MLYTSIISLVFALALEIELRVLVPRWVWEYVRYVPAHSQLDGSSPGITLWPAIGTYPTCNPPRRARDVSNAHDHILPHLPSTLPLQPIHRDIPSPQPPCPILSRQASSATLRPHRRSPPPPCAQKTHMAVRTCAPEKTKSPATAGPWFPITLVG
jgi:hypothetical protein